MQIQFLQHLQIYGQRHALSIRIDHEDGCAMIGGDEVVEPCERLRFAISYPFDLDDACEVFDYTRPGGWTRSAFAAAVKDAYRAMYEQPYPRWHSMGALFLESATQLAPGEWRLVIGS